MIITVICVYNYIIIYNYFPLDEMLVNNSISSGIFEPLWSNTGSSILSIIGYGF